MKERLRNASFLAGAGEADFQSLEVICEKNDGVRGCGYFVPINEPASRQNLVVRRRPVDDYPNRPGILPGFNFGIQPRSPSKSRSESIGPVPHSGDRSTRGRPQSPYTV